MQGDRLVTTAIDFGPFLTKPNKVGTSTPVSGVVILVAPSSGSSFNFNNIVYNVATDSSGKASISFSQRVGINNGWGYKASYPIGAYDTDKPTYSMVIFEDLRL